jgi:hypothetical protein
VGGAALEEGRREGMRDNFAAGADGWLSVRIFLALCIMQVLDLGGSEYYSTISIQPVQRFAFNSFQCPSMSSRIHDPAPASGIIGAGRPKITKVGVMYAPH